MLFEEVTVLTRRKVSTDRCMIQTAIVAVDAELSCCAPGVAL
jgi:hypothetical protein